jgi:putative tricarboxylic transport membrane protein
VQKIDRRVGIALTLLALVVLWSSKDFPAVPGQKVGAGFLPTIVGVGLLLCGLALMWRSRGAPAEVGAGEGTGTAPRGRIGSSFVIVGVTVGYIALADRLGFLIVAPLALFATFKAMQVSTRVAIVWSIGGTLLVHVAFYKLLRVPLPWGVLRPFY